MVLKEQEVIWRLFCKQKIDKRMYDLQAKQQ